MNDQSQHSSGQAEALADAIASASGTGSAFDALQSAVEAAQQQAAADSAAAEEAMLIWPGDHEQQAAARAARNQRTSDYYAQLNAEAAASAIGQRGLRQWEAAQDRAIAAQAAEAARRRELDDAVRNAYTAQ